MNLQQYHYHTNETFLDYEFYSEGPKGAIKKVVRFTLVETFGASFYNLGFGDWNEEQKRIDDFIISNNNDAERVLATVAGTVIDFTNHYPDVVIYAEGGTLSRTRRYQMGINKYWHEIDPLFEVSGLVENEGFQPFVKGTNYMAFAIRRKNQ